MKKYCYLIIFLFVFCVVKGQQKPSDTCFYIIKVPPDIDMPSTSSFDTTIVRNKNCTQIMRLPGWGTSTSYRLFVAGDSIKDKYAKRSCIFRAGGRGLMDITNLPDGSYTVWLTACGNGGFFTVRLKS